MTDKNYGTGAPQDAGFFQKYPHIPRDYKNRIPTNITQILDGDGELTQKDLCFIVFGNDTPSFRAYISSTLKELGIAGEARNGRKFYTTDVAFSLIEKGLGQWGDGTGIGTTKIVEAGGKAGTGKTRSPILPPKETAPVDKYATRGDMEKLELRLQQLISQTRGELGSELNRRGRALEEKVEALIEEATDGFLRKGEVEERLEDFRSQIIMGLKKYLQEQGSIGTSGPPIMKNGMDMRCAESSRGEYRGGLEDIGVKEYHWARAAAQYIERAVPDGDLRKVEQGIKDLMGSEPGDMEHQKLVGFANALKILKLCGAGKKDVMNQLIYVISNVTFLSEKKRLSIYGSFLDYYGIDPDKLGESEIGRYVTEIDCLTRDVETIIGDHKKWKLKDAVGSKPKHHKGARRKK